MNGRRVLVIFVDGLGIGVHDPSVNPIACFPGKILNFFDGETVPLPRGGRCLPTDPLLGVAGRPQSATGQTALFTGHNAPLRLGFHLQGFPNRTLRGMLAQASLFRCLVQAGGRPVFANAYTPRFFVTRPRWVSATTVMCETSGVPLKSLSDLKAGGAVFMDFSNRWLIDRGFDVGERSPAEAARILLDLTAGCDLCLYEYFLSDLVGHRGSLGDAVELASRLDEFLFEVVLGLDLHRVSLVICSDHGNLEDKATSLHTINPVPTLVWGDIERLVPEGAFSIMGITPLILRYLLSPTESDPVG